MVLITSVICTPENNSTTILSYLSNQAEDNLRREKNLEEAKKITIKNDPSLPEPKCVCMMLVQTGLNLGGLAT